MQRRRFLKSKEARKVIDDCDPKLKFCLYSALQTGMRKLEVIEAVPRWYDLAAAIVDAAKFDSSKIVTGAVFTDEPAKYGKGKKGKA